MPSHVLILCHAIEIRQIVTKGDNQQNKLSISRKATKLKMRFSVLLSLVKCMQPEEAKKIKNSRRLLSMDAFLNPEKGNVAFTCLQIDK